MSSIEVWIIDDEKDLTEICAESLGNSYRTLTFTSAQEALIAHEKHPNRYKVILSDIKMPGMSGFDFVSEMRKRNPKIPTILMSGTLDKETLKKATSMNIAGVIEKPFSISDLEGLIENAMELVQTESVLQSLIKLYLSHSLISKKLLGLYQARTEHAENLIKTHHLNLNADEKEGDRFSKDLKLTRVLESTLREIEAELAKIDGISSH